MIAPPVRGKMNAERIFPPGQHMVDKFRPPPIPAGEVLMEDFIEGLGITQHKVVVSIVLPTRRALREQIDSTEPLESV